jgi:hypothetical protein
MSELLALIDPVIMYLTKSLRRRNSSGVSNLRRLALSRQSCKGSKVELQLEILLVPIGERCLCSVE